jgi:hypothetical protein
VTRILYTQRNSWLWGLSVPWVIAVLAVARYWGEATPQSRMSPKIYNHGIHGIHGIHGSRTSGCVDLFPWYLRIHW